MLWSCATSILGSWLFVGGWFGVDALLNHWTYMDWQSSRKAQFLTFASFGVAAIFGVIIAVCLVVFWTQLLRRSVIGRRIAVWSGALVGASTGGALALLLLLLTQLGSQPPSATEALSMMGILFAWGATSGHFAGLGIRQPFDSVSTK